MDPNVVMEKIKAGAVVVDVRTPGEYRSGAYPEALNIPVQELSHRVSELPKNRPIVLYCGSGMRSASAVRLLLARGFSDVINGGSLDDLPR